MTDTPPLPPGHPGPPGQRIDQWLWHARFFKTRSLASRFVAAGQIRLSAGRRTQRITKASHALRPGDVLTFVLSRRVRVIQVAHLASRRGPAREAQTLYLDLSPPAETAPPPPAPRASGSGRPTKKQRRALQRLKSNL